MDRILSEFITRTSADPGFARDLLDCHKWDIKSALNAFYIMKGLLPSNELNENNLIDCDSKLINTNDVKINNYLNNSINKNSRFENQSQIVTIKCSSEPSLSSHSSESSNYSSNTSSPSKLAISKSDESANDIMDVTNKKLSRGISRATDNVNLVSKARNEFAQDFKTSSRGSRLLNTNSFLETPDFTFTLPDLSIHPEDFRHFLEQDLIEKSTLVSLETAGRLNWWSGLCQHLWPLATTGDGNCLLHAASLGMWGFHDRGLTLRKALHALLANSSYTAAFYRRWKWQTYFQNYKAGLIFSEHEWRQEWECLLKMASTEPRVRAQIDDNKSTEINGGKKNDIFDELQPHVYESLEELHIFALAHVLRRPIIVIADTMLKDITGEAFFPIPFGGIYLPLECPDNNLMKSPLCLTYDAAHFSALVSMDKETYADNHPAAPPAAIPLMDSEHNILPLQFVVDPGEEVFKKEQHFTDEIVKKLTISEKEKLKLLKQYFDVMSIKVPQNETDLLIEKKTPKRNAKILEKSRTLPSSFESDDSCSDAPSASSVGGNGVSKAKAFSTKAAKQLLMITKHFGSLGRMSKRIKKNLGTLAKRGTSFRIKNSDSSPKKKTDLKQIKSVQNYSSDLKKESFTNDETDSISYHDFDTIIAAHLHTDRRHSYYDEMIRNYLNTARARFLRIQREKKSNQTSSVNNTTTCVTSKPVSISATCEDTNLSYCVNIGCKMFGTSQNNYLCSNCFADQKQKLIQKSSIVSLTNNDCFKVNNDCYKANNDCYKANNDCYKANNDFYKANDISKAYDIDSHTQDMKVSLSSPKTKIVEEDVVISCANSHFYVPTST